MALGKRTNHPAAEAGRTAPAAGLATRPTGALPPRQGETGARRRRAATRPVTLGPAPATGPPDPVSPQVTALLSPAFSRITTNGHDRLERPPLTTAQPRSTLEARRARWRTKTAKKPERP
jgi:hypothetical protein